MLIDVLRLASQTVYSKADAHRSQVHRLGALSSKRLSADAISSETTSDDLQNLLQSARDAADQFSDDTSEWLLIEHRLQSIKDNFNLLSLKSTREHRELKVSTVLLSQFRDRMEFSARQTTLVQAEDIKREMREINSQLDHLESLNQSLEPVDDDETHMSTNRTKLHRFIRIQDDLEIVQERLIQLSERSTSLLSGDHLRIRNDLKLISERLNSIRRIVKIYLERLEHILAKEGPKKSFSVTNLSTTRSSNSNLQVGFFLHAKFLSRN